MSKSLCLTADAAINFNEVKETLTEWEGREIHYKVRTVAQH